jgi:Flp pilus assembly pilin Flp
MTVRKLQNFARDTEGATAVEYALIASGIVLVIIPVLGDVNSGVLSIYGVIEGLFDYVL